MQKYITQEKEYIKEWNLISMVVSRLLLRLSVIDRYASIDIESWVED